MYNIIQGSDFVEFDRRKYIELIQQRKFDDADMYRIENIPKKLYKFMYLSDLPKCKEKCELENLNDIKIKSIENSEFWLSTCKNLNDPFELKTLFLEEEKINKYNYPIELINQLKYSHYYGVLIGCFTTNLDNSMPMWAHYANNHRGFCIEYNIIKPKFFYPISYEGERAPANVAYMNCLTLIAKEIKGKITEKEKEDLDFYNTLLFHNSIIKDNSWEYENEYRLLFPRLLANKFVNVTENGAAIANAVLGIENGGIYIGMSCDEIYKDRLIKVGNKLGINVYQMFFDDRASKYKLSYKTIE